MEAKTCLNLVLLKTEHAGGNASGKSSLGHSALKSREITRSVSQDVAVKHETFHGFSLNVYNIEGLSYMSEEKIQYKLNKVLQKCESGPCAFQLLIKAERFTEEEKETVEKIKDLLGENNLEKTWIIFTNGEQLERRNETIKEFIENSERMKKFVEKYDTRYCVLNTMSKAHAEVQYKMLLVKLIQTSLDLKPSEGGRLKRSIALTRNSTPNEPVSCASSRRIVLLGKTGVGKSAAGNTILGPNMFESDMKMNSVTRVCLMKSAPVLGRSVSVVDTPGLFDTQMRQEDLAKEIARGVYLSSPGPHAFLIVFPVNMRFTEQEQQIADQVELMFGQEVLKYSIILFTHGDLLKGKTLEELNQGNCRLRHLVQQCGGRYHVFNNEDVENREQVEDLLQKIDSMIQQNGGGHYSNQMYEDAQRFRQEEEEERQREEERKQQNKQRLEEIEQMRKQAERTRAEIIAKRAELETERQRGNREFEHFYKLYENRFTFSAFVMSQLPNMNIGALVGGAVGSVLGAFGGPAGVALGAIAGATFGAMVGLLF